MVVVDKSSAKAAPIRAGALSQGPAQEPDALSTKPQTRHGLTS